MDIISISIDNGFVSGKIRIPAGIANENSYPNIMCYREKDKSYRSAGKIDRYNKNIIILNQLILDNQSDFQLYFAWNMTPKTYIGTLKRTDIEKRFNSRVGTKINTNTSYREEKDWWKFNQIDENFLKSIFLFPIRLIINIIFLIVRIPVTIIKLIIKIIVSAFIILSSLLIAMPIKIIGYIISFGYWNGFKNKFINRLNAIWDLN